MPQKRVFSDSDFVDAPKRTFDESSFNATPASLPSAAVPLASESPVKDFLNSWIGPQSVVGRSGAAAREFAMGGIGSLFHPIDTLQNIGMGMQEQHRKAEAEAAAGNPLRAAVRDVASVIPVIPGMAEHFADRYSRGEYAEMAGEGLALVAPGLPHADVPLAHLESGLKARAGSMADRMYESALKPRPRANTEAQVSSMVRSGLEEAVPISKKGLKKSDQIIKNLQYDIQNTIDAGADKGLAVSKYKAASRLGDTFKKFSEQANPESDLSTLAESGNEFMRNYPSEIPVDLAQRVKQGTYQQLKGKAFGELKGASIESQKAIAKGLKEELEGLFPNLKGLNQRQGNILSLQDELEGAVNRGKNKDLMGIATPIVAGSLGKTAGAVKSLIEMPGTKSRIAIALHRLSQR